MSDKTETVAEVVATMRQGTKLRGFWRSKDLNEILAYHAGRIEAAWKRERDELIYAYDPTKAGKGRLPDGSAYALEAMRHKPDPNWAETCAKCKDGEIEPHNCEYYGEPNGCNSPTYGEHPPVGNAAELRQAVIKALSLLQVCTWPSGVSLDGVAEVVHEIDSVLDKPSRNCDLYATYAEAAEAHKEYATAYIMRASNKFDSPMEFDEWLFAPAEERKGEIDGSK